LGDIGFMEIGDQRIEIIDTIRPYDGVSVLVLKFPKTPVQINVFFFFFFFFFSDRKKKRSKSNFSIERRSSSCSM